jgi:hypothetical protein
MKTHPAYPTLDEKLKDSVTSILKKYEMDVKTEPIGKGEAEEPSKPSKEASKSGKWWSSSTPSYDDIVKSAKKFKQTMRNKIHENISKPRLILRLNDLIRKEATLSAKKDQLNLTSETPKITADV